MNKKSVAIPMILLILSIVTSAAAVIFRCILSAEYLDIHGLYQRGTSLPTVFHILLTVFTVLPIFIAFIAPSRFDEQYRARPSLLSSVVSFIAGLLLAVDAASVIYNIIVEKIMPTGFQIWEIIFSLLAAVFFIAAALKPGSDSPVFAFLSLAPIAWCTVYLISIYFDKELLMTDPGSILKQVALLSAMLAFLNETRSHIGIFARKFFLASASVSPILLLTSAIPDVLFSDKLILGFSDSIIKALVRIAFALFFLLRLGGYAFSKNPTDKD